jgi:hypothetical protein
MDREEGPPGGGLAWALWPQGRRGLNTGAGPQREVQADAGAGPQGPRARERSRRPNRSEAAELAGDDLDAQLVADATDVGDRDLQVAGDLERVAAGEAIVLARVLLDDLDKPWDVARDHEGSLTAGERDHEA